MTFVRRPAAPSGSTPAISRRASTWPWWGNHKLDWGTAHLRRWGSELPFPLLAANLPLGLPATRMLSADVGVIGLSLPGMAEMHPGLHAEPVDIAALAGELRAAGARHVVLAVHDGVDADSTERMRALCERVRGSVDLVFGGHTPLPRRDACRSAVPAAVGVRQPGRHG
jgi:2',3'-cyclic-nucleotide 2'-phosphodiesterase (5'-nucleotidase family)